MKKLLATLVTLVMIVSSLAALTSCGATDGVTPTIGENGNWFIGDVDTGVPATGPKGDKGDKGDRGNAGQDGTAGTAGTNGATPTFRINGETGTLEISYDGETWTDVAFVEVGQVPVSAVDPNLLDDSLTEYNYPMDTVTPAAGCITYYLKYVKNDEEMDEDEYKADPDCHKYVISDEYSAYRIAFINIEGTVFTGAKFTGNAAAYMGWFWLDEMPREGELIDYAGGMEGIHETARGVGSQTGKVDMESGAKILAVVYSKPDSWNPDETVNVLPTGILFVK